MGEMRFDYRILPSEPFAVPAIDVLVYGTRDTSVLVAVVDTGAVRPIFPKYVAEEAGVLMPTKPHDWIQYGAGRANAWTVETHIGIGWLMRRR
jgi:hypothetical protein